MGVLGVEGEGAGDTQWDRAEVFYEAAQTQTAHSRGVYMIADV